MIFRRRKSIEKVKYKTVIKKAVNSYIEIMEKLYDLGISKKEELTGALGEYYCKELFGLDLNENCNHKGFDGYYGTRRIEVKTRTFNNPYYRFSKKKLECFDWAFLVLLDDEYNLSDIFAVARSVILRKIPKGGTFNLSQELIESYPKRIKHIYHDKRYSGF